MTDSATPRRLATLRPNKARQPGGHRAIQAALTQETKQIPRFTLDPYNENRGVRVCGIMLQWMTIHARAYKADAVGGAAGPPGGGLSG